MSFILLPEYKQAIDSLKAGNVTFCSGAGGTGKSTFIKYMRHKVKNTLLFRNTSRNYNFLNF